MDNRKYALIERKRRGILAAKAVKDSHLPAVRESKVDETRVSATVIRRRKR